MIDLHENQWDKVEIILSWCLKKIMVLIDKFNLYSFLYEVQIEILRIFCFLCSVLKMFSSVAFDISDRQNWFILCLNLCVIHETFFFDVERKPTCDTYSVEIEQHTRETFLDISNGIGIRATCGWKNRKVSEKTNMEALSIKIMANVVASSLLYMRIFHEIPALQNRIQI